MEYILAIDQSTSATKLMLFGKEAKPLYRITLPHQQIYPEPGWVEHDPMEIMNNLLKGLKEILVNSGTNPSSVKTIAITNQRETALIWDKMTGKPVCNAVVWQCQRGSGFCQKLRESGLESTIRKKTGLMIDPYFSASKLNWIMENIFGNSTTLNPANLLLGTIDSWLIWNLTGGKKHITDITNACRTMLFNIHTLEWDNDLLKLFGLPAHMFPEVIHSDTITAWSDPSVTWGRSIPICGIMGDSHAALFGQACLRPGMAKVTYGTGSSIMIHTGYSPMAPPDGLVTSIGFAYKGNVHYVFEGNIHSTGDTLAWLVNNMEMLSSATESESLALSVENNNGVYLVPAFNGLGAPYWDNAARAAVTGMARNTKKAHVVRAALESIAYQVKDLTNIMQNQGEVSLKELRVDGGASRNNFLMQFQSDMIQCNVVRANIEEASALGVAFMAGITTGMWNGTGEIKNLLHEAITFRPHLPAEKANKLYQGWKQAVNQVRTR